MGKPIPVVSICLPADGAYFEIVKKGDKSAKSSSIKVFHQAFVGGCYIGFGGLLSMVIGGQIPGASAGTQKFVFAALFPVNLLLILLTGGSLFTGNTAAMPAAVFEGKAKWHDAIRCLVVSWCGNFAAAAMFAALTEYANLCPVELGDDGTVDDYFRSCGNLAIKVVKGKVAKTWGQTFVKGIMCNWMVCMAVFLSSQAQDMTGKMVGIWFPISAFVMMGMEHSVANMFMLPLGLICGSHDPNFTVTTSDIFVKNMIPVSLGNLFAGAICVAASYSYAFGKLGKTWCGLTDKPICSMCTVGCHCVEEVRPYLDFVDPPPACASKAPAPALAKVVVEGKGGAANAADDGASSDGEQSVTSAVEEEVGAAPGPATQVKATVSFGRGARAGQSAVEEVEVPAADGKSMAGLRAEQPMRV